MTFYEQIVAALGAVPSIEARPTLSALRHPAAQQHTALKYEWITNWSALDGLDFWDGEHWITFRATVIS